MPNPGFTLAEDAALKNRLRHLTVTDDKNGQRPVQVFFRWPSGETEVVYPMVTIDLVDIRYAPERALSEVNYYYAEGTGLTPEEQETRSTLTYYPSEFNESDLADMVGESGYMSTEQFVPVDLIYQVSTHSRLQRHDRQLTMLMLRRVFPFKRGFIDIPEDGTIRRCELVSWRNTNVLDQETGYKKDIFRKVFTISISAEIPQSDFIGAQRVETVDGLLTDNNPSTDVLSAPFTEDF